MPTLTTTSRVEISTEHRTAADLGTIKDDLTLEEVLKLTNGTGANQGNMQWHDQRSIAASSNDDLDLAGGLTDQFGNTLTFARVKLLYIKALSTNANDLHVGGGSNPFITHLGASGDIIVLPPGADLLIRNFGATAFAVTAGTGDILRLTNSAGGSAILANVVILGVDT